MAWWAQTAVAAAPEDAGEWEKLAAAYSDSYEWKLALDAYRQVPPTTSIPRPVLPASLLALSVSSWFRHPVPAPKSARSRRQARASQRVAAPRGFPARTDAKRA